MILNKNISLILTGCFFLLLMLVSSSVLMIVLKGGSIPFTGVILIVAFYFVSRAFYNYLRNDEFYKNTRQYSSDAKGEKYIIKGEKDSKKIFIIVWVIVILILASAAMWMHLINNSLI